MSSFKDWRVLSTRILTLRAIWRPVIIVALGVVATWGRPVSVRLGAVILVAVYLLDWGRDIYVFHVADLLERLHREWSIATSMLEDGYVFREIARTVSWTRRAPQVFTDAGLVGSTVYGEQVPLTLSYGYRPTSRGPQFLVPVPLGRSLKSFEDKIEALQAGFNHRAIEIRSSAYGSSSVEILFVLREPLVHKQLPVHRCSPEPHFGTGDFFIWSPQRSPYLRISAPRGSSKISMARALIDSVTMDIRYWSYSIIDIDRTGGLSEIPLGVNECDVITGHQLAEDAIQFYYVETLKRLRLLDDNHAEHWTELPGSVRPDPHLLIIDGGAAFLIPNPPDDMDDEQYPSKREDLLQIVARNSRATGIHVVLALNPLFGIATRDVTLQEALIAIDVGAYSPPKPVVAKQDVSANITDHLFRHLGEFTKSCHHFVLRCLLPIEIARTMKELSRDHA